MDNVAQSSMTMSGAPLSCSGTLFFTLSGLTPGYSYTFAFSVEDSAGEVSDWSTVMATAS